MPPTERAQLLSLPHITPIACENCDDAAHLVRLTTQAAMNGHALRHVQIWTFECTACQRLTAYQVDD